MLRMLLIIQRGIAGHYLKGKEELSSGEKWGVLFIGVERFSQVIQDAQCWLYDTVVIPAHVSMRQKNHDLDASQGYIEIPCQK